MDAIEQLQRAGLLQERQVVPAPQPQKQPVWHRGHGSERVAVGGVASERRRNQRIDDARVEAVAAERHATGRQDGARVAGGQLRPDTQERKIAGATAEVGHQDQLFVIEAGRVAKGGRDGLELENDLRETGLCQGGAHAPHGARVVVSRRRRPSNAPGGHDHGPRGQRAVDGAAKLFEVGGDEGLERPEPPADHRARERGARQVRLDRLHEAALAFVPSRSGRWPARPPAAPRPDRNGARSSRSSPSSPRRPRQPRQVGQCHVPVILGERERSVGGSEIDPDMNGHRTRFTSSAARDAAVRPRTCSGE